MKTLLTLIFLTIAHFALSQQNNNLLLIRIEKRQDLKIDKLKEYYFIIELDSNKNLLNDKSKLAFFSDFTDTNLFNCKNKDSVRLKTYNKVETFEHENLKGIKNKSIIEENSKKMKKMMEITFNSSLIHKVKMKISYALLDCNYCIGYIAKYDADFIGYNGEIALVTDIFNIDNNYELSKDKIYDIVKKIELNLIW